MTELPEEKSLTLTVGQSPSYDFMVSGANIWLSNPGVPADKSVASTKNLFDDQKQ